MPDGLRQQFTGYEADAETALNFAQARYQSNVQGRFTGVDSIGGTTSNPQSFHRYAYVQNDPLNFVDPSGLSICSAEFSYGQCGGNDGFWGGGGGSDGGFGDDTARHNREFAGVPAHAVGAYADYLWRLQNTYDALAATAAYRRGGPNDPTYLAIMKRNPTLVTIAALSRGQRNALTLISLLFGQAVGDRVRFDVVAQLTGLSNYIRSSTYQEDTRTFDVLFTSTSDVGRFLATSPYFAGPGIAFEHLNVGTFD